ncbi:MAG: hypothetical protein JNL75_02655 [Chitinophagales bacterium]|nr:hypothetical protein [Chitinophagales bacterium]
MKRLGCTLCFFLLGNLIFAQETKFENFDIIEHSIHLPYEFRDWKYKQALGFSLIYLPKDWLETALSLPMVYYKSNFFLKKGFAVNADLRTVIAASDIAIGPSWNTRLGKKFFLGLGYQTSFGLGMLYDMGYDNTLTVWGHRPYFKFGYLHKDLTFTCKGGIDFTNKLQFEAGATSLSGNIESLNGYHMSLFLEQRMFKNKSFSIGYTSNFMKFHILGWPAFSYTKNIYYIPELTTLFNF